MLLVSRCDLTSLHLHLVLIYVSSVHTELRGSQALLERWCVTCGHMSCRLGEEGLHTWLWGISWVQTERWRRSLWSWRSVESALKASHTPHRSFEYLRWTTTKTPETIKRYALAFPPAKLLHMDWKQNCIYTLSSVTVTSVTQWPLHLCSPVAKHHPTAIQSPKTHFNARCKQGRTDKLLWDDDHLNCL